MDLSAIQLISLCAVKMTAYRQFQDGTRTGCAKMSGFLWRKDGNTFLITNWHNVTGCNPVTEAPMSNFIPTHFSCEFRSQQIDGGGSGVLSQEISIFDDEDNPIWIEHPSGRLVDVVAIPLACELPDGYQLDVINERDFEKTWQPRIGDDGFIVGYPEGISGPNSTPIWKRGSVATEPSLNYQEQPVFLMDTIGNKGLSGSPVIGRGSGVYKKDQNGGALALTDIIGTWENFIGIYAGRVAEQGIGSQLGRVWKESVIEEILSQ